MAPQKLSSAMRNVSLTLANERRRIYQRQRRASLSAEQLSNERESTRQRMQMLRSNLNLRSSEQITNTEQQRATRNKKKKAIMDISLNLEQSTCHSQEVQKSIKNELQSNLDSVEHLKEFETLKQVNNHENSVQNLIPDCSDNNQIENDKSFGRSCTVYNKLWFKGDLKNMSSTQLQILKMIMRDVHSFLNKQEIFASQLNQLPTNIKYRLLTAIFRQNIDQMIDLDDTKKNSLIIIIDVYIPFLKKLLEHFKKKNDPCMKKSYDKLIYVYQIFTEGDIKEKLDIYCSCQDILEKWLKRYKDLCGKKPKKCVKKPKIDNENSFGIDENLQCVSSENSVFPATADSMLSVQKSENKLEFATNDDKIDKEMDVSVSIQLKPGSSASVHISPVPEAPLFNAERPLQTISITTKVQPAATQKISNQEILFDCASCQFSTTNEADFMKHARTDHRTDLSLWCKNCESCFSNAGMLVYHIKEAKCRKEEMIYRCGVENCPFSTPSGPTFVHHLRHCHRGNSFIFCIHCRKIFSLPHCLILHMQNDCPFKEKNRTNPNDKPLQSTPVINNPISSSPQTILNKTNLTYVALKPSSSNYEPPKMQFVPTLNKTVSFNSSLSCRGRGRPPARRRYTRNSKVNEDSSESDDPDDPSWFPEESTGKQPLRRSARWASRVSEAKDPEIEPDGTIIPRSKNKSIVEPTDKIIECPCCDFSTALESLLQDHYIASHKSEKKTACLVCNVKFEDLETFVDHFGNHHRKGEKLPVLKDISDSSNDSLFKMMTLPEPKHANPQVETLKDIPIENAIGKFVDNFNKEHMNIPYQTDTNQIINESSKIKYFEDLKSPNDILKMKIEPKLKHFFKCSVYDCTFTTDDDKFYVIHLNERHKNKKIHCSYCFQEFSETSAVVEHMFQEHDKRCYQCSICFYRAISKPHVQLHIKSVHMSVKARVFTCSLHLPANYMFKEEKKNSEPTIFPYICAVNECEFKTFIPKEFITHNLEHKSCSQFFCYYCKEYFTSSKDLISHYHSHGINNFQCTYCIQGADTREKILLHLCNHHADNVFKVYCRSSGNEC